MYRSHAATMSRIKELRPSPNIRSRTHPEIADDTRGDGRLEDNPRSTSPRLQEKWRRIRPEEIGEAGGGGGEENRDKKELPVCRLPELCECNDVNTRLCRSSMQRLPKGLGDAGGKISQTSGRRPDKEHPRSPYVDTRRSEDSRHKGRARRERRRRLGDSRKQLSNTIS